MTAYGTADITLVDQFVYYQAFYLDRDTLLSGVEFSMSNAGDYTAADSNQVALFSYSAGTLTLLRKSKSRDDIWKSTASTMIKEPFTDQYDAVKGLYILAAIYNQSGSSDAPRLNCGAEGSLVGKSLDLTNSAKLSGSESAFVTFPASRSMADINRIVNTLGLFPY